MYASVVLYQMHVQYILQSVRQSCSPQFLAPSNLKQPYIYVHALM